MENLIILVHLLMALAIVGLILLQQGKGAEMGASFGSGASQTLFGASGSGNFFAKLTAVCAFVFFVTSFGLAILAKNKASVDESLVPSLVETPITAPEEESTVVDPDLPQVDATEDAANSESDIPQVPEN